MLCVLWQTPLAVHKADVLPWGPCTPDAPSDADTEVPWAGGWHPGACGQRCCVGLDRAHMDMQGPRSCLCALAATDPVPYAPQSLPPALSFSGDLCLPGDPLFCPAVSGEEAETEGCQAYVVLLLFR